MCVCLCVWELSYIYKFYSAILFFVNMPPSETYPAILYWTSRKQVVENNCGETSAWRTSSSPFFTMHVTQFLQYRNYRTTRGNRCLVCIVEFLWETWGSIISEFTFERAQLFRCCGSPRVRGARPGANHLDHDGHPSRLQRIACTCRQAIQANLQEYRFPTIPPQISMGHQVSSSFHAWKPLQTQTHGWYTGSAACSVRRPGDGGERAIAPMWFVLRSFRSDCQT